MNNGRVEEEKDSYSTIEYVICAKRYKNQDVDKAAFSSGKYEYILCYVFTASIYAYYPSKFPVVAKIH